MSDIIYFSDEVDLCDGDTWMGSVIAARTKYAADNEIVIEFDQSVVLIGAHSKQEAEDKALKHGTKKVEDN